MNRPRSLLGILAVALISFAYLLIDDPASAAALALRLAPIMAFLALISIVVNLAAPAGAFNAVIAATTRSPGRDRGRSRPWVIWLTVLSLSLIATIFLSLDTTALLMTPVAVALARREGLHPVGAALAVIWVANIGSMLLPVSNLTNLLAVESPHFSGGGEFLRYSGAPAVMAILVVSLATALRFRASRTSVETDAPPRLSEDGAVLPAPVGGPLLRISLIVLAFTLPLLATPIPYWLTAGAGALIMVVAFGLRAPGHLKLGLVPWSSILLAVTFSAAAQALHSAGLSHLIEGMFTGWDDSPVGLLGIAFTGAGLSNVLNNIPAFLALEPGVTSPTAMMALLIGTNIGPLITPWASLATLLWWDQLRRHQVQVSWSAFILPGLLLAPTAVALSTMALWIVS
ncbi:Arsenical pump membrane protein [Corynebacterium occultum]|uniref:Arsenical pump membrane protein n=1 Tax=Corynebacterium occultum TaxID=2675219 RepID=A0A6B8WAG6_9CORY|nr:SLC13 family permease [Corynebacterium occultum]QGU08275.1 Arsenical pump membrane protein [Corynebacterium occultum]